MPQRRQMLSLLGTGIGSVIAGCSKLNSTSVTTRSADGAATAWPIPRGTPTNTGFSSSGGPGKTATQGGELTFKDGFVSIRQKSPIIGSDGVYGVAKNKNPYEEDPTTSRVYAYAFDPDGAERWRRTIYEGKATGDKSVLEIKVWSVTGCLGPDALFVFWSLKQDKAYCTAVSRDGGETIWSQEIRGIKTLSRPVLSDGSLYLFGDEKVLSLNTTDGSEQWRTSVGSIEQPYPAVGNGIVVVNYSKNDRRRVAGLDTSDGTTVWSTNLKLFGLETPTIAGDHVYIASGGEKGLWWQPDTEDIFRYIWALSTEDGSIQWKRPYGSEIAESFAPGGTGYVTVVDDTLYYALGFSSPLANVKYKESDESSEEFMKKYSKLRYDGPNVFALDRHSGDLIWKTKVGEFPRVFRPPVADENHLYLPYWGQESDTEIRVVERETGKHLGSFGPIPNKREFGVSGGNLYVQSDESVLIWN